MPDVKVTMPQMGETIIEGTILVWLKAEGERVEADEPLLEIETEKVDSELPAPASGVLQEILVGEGETVEVGTVLAVIATEVEVEATPPAAPVLEQERAAEAEEVVREEPVEAEAERAEAPARRWERDGRRITPVVARLADEHGIDLKEVEGTGIGGRVTKQDLLGYLEAREAKAPPAQPVETAPAVTPSPEAPPAPPPKAPAVRPEADKALEETVPLKGMRKIIAEHMVRSVQTAPHVTTVAEIDFTRLVQFRERVKEEFHEEEGIPLTYMPFIVRAVCHGLARYPSLNASLQDEHILLKKYYHIGVAVALDEGLVVPVVRNADRMDIRQLARTLHQLAESARAKKLPVEEFQGGTFTITNPGALGAILSTPIIHQPQSAILGVEAIQPRPVVRDEQIVIRHMAYLCLSYDHRILDGATAIQFLQYVRRMLENPLNLIM
ncbi:MAG: dihydrolipoamide acetyltransferase family protein [Thermoplasmata archaeon]